MYPYHWTWLYTLLVLVFLLSVFLLACAVLLIRRGRRRAKWHRTPASISTPQGQVGYWDVTTQKMFAEGMRRARMREYYNPRGER
jgi:hypothetical protein